LWLYHTDGGSGLALTSSELAGGLAGPVFSPDGRHVFFSSRAGGGGGGGGLGFAAWQVRRLDRITGDVATITASPNGAFRPAISPDGEWLVYGARLDAQTGLRIRHLPSDREEWLIYPIDRDNAERSGNLDLMPAFDFTPDGTATRSIASTSRASRTRRCRFPPMSSCSSAPSCSSRSGSPRSR
jgi:dipeptidyl aminopeptidase/acylaminoacyl peptidase